jgi:hypothetical protein
MHNTGYAPNATMLRKEGRDKGRMVEEKYEKPSWTRGKQNASYAPKVAMLRRRKGIETQRSKRRNQILQHEFQDTCSWPKATMLWKLKDSDEQRYQDAGSAPEAAMFGKKRAEDRANTTTALSGHLLDFQVSTFANVYCTSKRLLEARWLPCRGGTRSVDIVDGRSIRATWDRIAHKMTVSECGRAYQQ